MYDSSMRNETYPLAVPDDLLREIRKTARETGLSMADVMRQGIRLGLPKLRADLSKKTLKPFTPEEAARAFAPDAEWDAVAAAMTTLPVPMPEEE